MKTNTIETADLGVASALSCLGFPILSLDRHNPRRVAFRFDASSAIEDAMKTYWDGSLRLPPAALFTHQKILKQRLYSEHD
ncbi:MAG: DUF5659 domain-containing protein [Candidatus Peregrinibacteria bacterium]